MTGRVKGQVWPLCGTTSKQVMMSSLKTSSVKVPGELDPVLAKKQKKDANTLLAAARTASEKAVSAFLGAPKLENHHQLIEDIAAKMDGEISLWADAALLTLSARKTGAPESRELSAKALDAGWQNPKRRVQILRAAGEIKHGAYADRILAALDDADKTVAAEARSAASKMKLEKKTKDTSPIHSSAC